MNFKEFSKLLRENFEDMASSSDRLFVVDVDKDEMYNIYLDSFADGYNMLYRVRREYDCSFCRNFIKNIGNVVAITDSGIRTIWKFPCNSDEFAPVMSKLNDYVVSAFKSGGISNVFFTNKNHCGIAFNFEFGKIYHHFHVEIPNQHVATRRSVGDLQGELRDTKNVFKRSLDEITIDAIDTVLELISQNSLYRGEEWKAALQSFREFKAAYSELGNAEKELFAWKNGTVAGAAVGRIRNHSMGVLLTDISSGMNLDDAVRKYEQIVAPNNYKRSKPIYTKKMLEQAQKAIVEAGYMDSLPRRFATLDDITVNDILFSNKDSASRIAGATNIFDDLAKSASGNAKQFSKVEEVSVDKFISDILPTARNIELYFDNSVARNMVSMIAPQNKDSKPMFRWGNSFGWAYTGNMTDSMKENVKAAGGSVTGDLRFSIQWNEDGTDNVDLDAHCITPATEIYYMKKQDSATGGVLDVDIIDPKGEIAVENITWETRKTMRDGSYDFYVHQFSGSVKKGFRAEIEFDGNIYSFDYPHSMRPGEKVFVANVVYKNGKFTIKEKLKSSSTTKTVWGIQTNDFVPVSVVCFSPNWWETAIKNNGHKHLFFMLKDCINDENPSGIFNEYLVQELYEHRKVMEAMGEKLRVADSNDQLSGVGFAMDKRSEVVLKVTGATERIIKVKF